MDDYKAFVRRNSDGKALAEIDSFVSLEAIPRFNDVGAWVLELEVGSVAASLLTWGAGILVTRNGEDYFSGLFRGFNREWAEDRDVLIAHGLDDMAYIDFAVAHPSPTDGDFSTQSHDVRTDAGETLLKEYVDYNVGPNALPERQNPLISLEADAGLGDSSTERARLQPLLEFLRRIAIKTGGLGFRVVNGEFQVYEPEDKAEKILFNTDLGNLLSFSYRADAPEANYIYVGGSGLGVARTFEERGDSTSIVRHGRIEKFRDRRDTGDSAELILTAVEELELHGEKSSVRFEPTDIESIKFVDDYDLGDKITAQIDGVDVDAVIREVPLKLTREEGARIVPSISTPEEARADEIIRLYDRTRELDRRLQNLENV